MVHWDDLQLLKLIDELEQAGQSFHLRNGLELLIKAAGDQGVQWNEDQYPFARELLLACDAGYLTWKDQGVLRLDPLGDPPRWLQEIWDIRLTLVGRDRARGRVVQRPLPDPDEDDDRPITGMTLEEIARAIGDTYTPSQLPRYLEDSGIPGQFLEGANPEARWAYVLAALEGLHGGGSAARRTLREFIGGWLEGRLHVGPPEDVRRRIVALLGQQGWHISDGRLVIGEKSYDASGALTPVGRDARIATLHPEVRLAAKRYVDSGHLEVAIFEASKATSARIRTLTELDLDGSDLINRALADKDPMIVLADVTTETGRNIQSGYRFLFLGAVRAVRNPDAHEPFGSLSQEESLERLGLWSMLMRRLDEVVLARSQQQSDG